MTWPLSLPDAWVGAAFVFIPCFGIFVVPGLAGGTRVTLIGNLIKQRFLDNRDRPLGSTLSLALVGAVLGVVELAPMAARSRHGAWIRGHRAASKRVRAAELEAAPSMMSRGAS